MIFWPFGKRIAPVERPTTIPLVSRFSRLSQRGLLTASQPDRLTTQWETTPYPADTIVRRHQRILVARSRHQARGNDYGRAFLRMVAQNIVGPNGIRLQSQVQRRRGRVPDAEVNDAIEAGWCEWGRAQNCDVAGRLSWRQIQKLAIVTEAKDGEYFIRIVHGRDAGPWSFALQVLDPQRCPVEYDVERAADGSFIRHGIQFNQFGRPLAYFFTTTNEREADRYYGSTALIRIPAEEIIHGFRVDMVGQKRGLPWMATAMWRLQMLGQYEQSALVNARISASQGGFFKWSENSNGPDREDDDEPLIMEVEAGIWRELPVGAEPVPNHPQYPAGELPQFRKEMLRAAASGLGVAYNNFASDLEGVNYSSIRQGTLDEREAWKEAQEDLIDQLLRRVFDTWLPIALLSGRIRTASGKPLPATDLDRLNAATWQARRWTWVDPQADVKAAVDMKNNLMGSFSQYIRDQGRDPQEVWREIAADIEGMRAAGIPEDYIKQAITAKQATPAQAKPPTAGDAAPPPEETPDA